MPYRGQQPAAAVASWTPLFDEDLTTYPTTDLKAGETYTTALGDLWDSADSYTTVTSMQNYGFVSGAGLRLDSTSASAVARHDRLLSAAAAAAGWALAANDEIVVAARLSSQFSGAGITTMWQGVSMLSDASRLIGAGRRESSADVLRLLATNSSSSQWTSPDASTSGGVVVGLRIRRGMVQGYSGSTWPTAGAIATSLTYRNSFSYYSTYPDCVLPTTSGATLTLHYISAVAQDTYVTHWGAWIRRG